MFQLLNDLRYTLRQLRRSPGFTVTAMLTLALGIGATTMMYQIVRSTLLAPLPYAHQEELVGVGFSRPGESANSEQTGETADFLLAHASSFLKAGVADDGSLEQNFSTEGKQPRTIRSLRVSAGYLPVFGVAPLWGRTFTQDEDTPGAAPTAVLSEKLWRRTLNADPAIVGRIIRINGDSYTVIGVMPSTLDTVDTPDLWQPLHLSSADPGYQGDNYQFVGRLKTGVSLQQATAEFGALTQGVYRQYPDYLKWGPPGAPRMQEFVWPLRQIVVSRARSSILALSAAVLAVLLIACLNLAGLILARSTVRRPEIALRTALGADRARVLRLLLTESLVLALTGSLLGLAFAHLAVPILVKFSPIDLPLVPASGFDVSVSAFAIALGCLTTLLFGVLPALSTLRHSAGLRPGGGTAVGNTEQQKLGKALVVGQVALSTVLLSASGLLLGTFLYMRSIPSGVQPQHLYALQVSLKGDAYTSSAHSQHFVSAVEDRLRQIPGVERVATVNGLPLDRGLNSSGGPAFHPELVGYTETRFITPGYFGTVGTPLLRGADVSDADTAITQPVALINERAAKQWFPDRSPIGEFVVSGGGPPARVIGLVANVHDASLAGDIKPTIYLPYAQTPDASMKAINGWFSTTFLLRTAERGPVPGPDIAAAVAAVDPEVPASKFAPMQSFIDRTVAAPRFFSWLAGGFASFALLLTLVGLFGLLSYQVAARTRDIGVRMALGASRRKILILVLRSGLLLTSTGLVLGIIGSLILRNLISALIADTARVGTTVANSALASPFVSLALAGAAMLASAVAASLLPARRAASIEPIEALKTE